MYRQKSCNHWSEDSVWRMPYTTPQAKKMLYYIQEAGDFTAYSQYYTERENLSSFLIVYTLSGDGKLLYRKNEYPLRAGSVFFINCMDYQLYQNDSKYPWHFLWIHFNGCSSLAYFEEFMKGGTPVLYTEEISREEEYCIAFPGRMPEGARPVIEENLRSILNCCADMKFQTEILVSHAVETILTLLLSASCKKRLSVCGASVRIEEMMKYIDRHHGEKITLDTLAAEFAQNKYTLQKEFKRAVGLTPTAYTIACRINHARELLRYSDLTVNEIAYKVGMDNVSHFINLFKKSENLTPGSFKRIWNQEERSKRPGS